MTLRRMTKTIGLHLLMAVILIYTLFPVYCAAITSFADDGNQFERHCQPENLSLENLAQILHQRNFSGACNEFLFAKTFLFSAHLHTVSLSMSMSSGVVQQREPKMAASIIVTVPIVARVMQRRIVSGLTAGSVVA